MAIRHRSVGQVIGERGLAVVELTTLGANRPPHLEVAHALPLAGDHGIRWQFEEGPQHVCEGPRGRLNDAQDLHLVRIQLQPIPVTLEGRGGQLLIDVLIVFQLHRVGAIWSVVEQSREKGKRALFVQQFSLHEILQLYEEAFRPGRQQALPFCQVRGQGSQMLLAGEPCAQGCAWLTEALPPGFPAGWLAGLVEKHEVQLQRVERVGFGTQELDATLDGTVNHFVIAIASEGDVWLGALEQVLVETEFLAQTAQRALEAPCKGIEFGCVAPFIVDAMNSEYHSQITALGEESMLIEERAHLDQAVKRTRGPVLLRDRARLDGHHWGST